MNKRTISLPGTPGEWGSYVSKYQPDSQKVLDNMFTSGSKNFVTDQTGMIDKRQGGIQWNRTPFAQAAADTYEAVFESGARHFLRVGGGILSASTGTGLFDTITSGYSTIGFFEWATYQDRIYGCNGVNAPQVYDTATNYGGVSYVFTTGKTKVMGAQAPVSAPVSHAPTAGGSIPVGSHTYKVTYLYYDSEESNGSAASGVQNATAGNQTISLTSIPVGGYGVTARNIYRDNNDGVYLLLATINDNTTTTYSDTLLIGATPTPIPQFNNTPPTFSKIALWQDSLWVAPTGETNIVRYSNAGEPDIYDPDNFVRCQSDDVITALYVYNGKLYVFGLHSFGSIEGNTPDTFYYNSINPLIGCVDNRSIQVRSIVSVPTLWWLSDKGMYYSNGYTVEYGSDLIQDLVNLNIAQVNYAINKNTQTSQTDFAGDTFTPSIDITSQPGEITLHNPTQAYSTTPDWDGGSLTVNTVTERDSSMSAVTQFAPSAASGGLSGQAVLSGSNVQLQTYPDFTGEQHNAYDFVVPRPNAGDGVFPGMDPHFGLTGTMFMKITVPRAGTMTSMKMPHLSIAFVDQAAPSVHVTVRSNSGVFPGGILFDQQFNMSGTGATLIFHSSFNIFQSTYQQITVFPSLHLAAGTYWVGFERVQNGANFAQVGIAGVEASHDSVGCVVSGHFTETSYINCSNIGAFGDFRYNFSLDAVPASGGWLSPVYDTFSNNNAVASQLTIGGLYPGVTTTTITVSGSLSPSMSSPATQVFTNLDGTATVTLLGYRYWTVQYALSTTDDRTTQVVGILHLNFALSATWISQPIDTTTDNTGFTDLRYTGVTPFGTSITLTIATSPDNITYTSYVAIGSAVTNRWAKIKAIITTTSDNVTSASIFSLTLDWGVTGTITSNIIDTGTTPAGFGTVLWELINLSVGTVTFYIRTASSPGGIPGATFVQVDNGMFPNLTPARYIQWKLVMTGTPDALPEVTSITVNWFISVGTVGVRCASLFFNKTYYLSVATIGATANNVLIQMDQFGKWRIQKDTSIGTFLTYFNTLYFTDGINGNIYNGFVAATDNGTSIAMDVRTKAWTENQDIYLKIPRGLKITGLHTGTELHAYYSVDRGNTWIEMVNENGQIGYQTNITQSEFVVLFVPDAITLQSGRTLMYRIVSEDEFPCSILNFEPSMYTRVARFLNNG